MSEPPSSEPPSTQRPPGLGVKVAVENDQTDHPINENRWARLAALALSTQGVDHGHLSLTFVDQPTMAELNRQYMGANGPTDVLAFPIDGPKDAGDPRLPVLLGDVVICPAVAAANAADHRAGGLAPHPGHPHHSGEADDELALLVVHGVLHVLGYDHAEPDDAAAMHRAERQILAQFADLNGTNR